MLDSGNGESHVNTIISSLLLPPVSSKILKKHERLVGKAIEEVAKDSCIEAIRLEKQKTKEAIDKGHQ